MQQGSLATLRRSVRYNRLWAFYRIRENGVDRVIVAIRRFFADRGLTGTPGAGAVSGGPDSVALLRAVLEADVGPVHVVHFDHKVRGAESAADAVFVEELATQFRLPFHRFDADPATLAGDNFESAARTWRYRTLAAVAAEHSLHWVATGHTADDQAETVLHRLIRGTGVQGLRGIAAVRRLDPSPTPPRNGEGPTPPSRFGKGAGGLGSSVLVRPLLAVTRADVLAYLAAIKQPFRTDSTNADPGYTRNRIRHELLPLLKSFNPDVVATLAQTAEQAEELFTYLRAEAEDLLRRAERPRAGAVLVFDRVTLETAPPHRVRDLFRLVFERESWSRDQMTSAHWHRLAALTVGDYPDGVSLRVTAKVVQLDQWSKTNEPEA
jgi:tRNA(Ile)-lysidine synthase